MTPGITLNLIQVRDINVKPDVTWQAPVTISGPSDVTTQGTYFGSWAPQDGGANTLPVNGVTFQGFSDLPLFTAGPTFYFGDDIYRSPRPPRAKYNKLF